MPKHTTWRVNRNQFVDNLLNLISQHIIAHLSVWSTLGISNHTQETFFISYLAALRLTLGQWLPHLILITGSYLIWLRDTWKPQNKVVWKPTQSGVHMLFCCATLDYYIYESICCFYECLLTYQKITPLSFLFLRYCRHIILTYLGYA